MKTVLIIPVPLLELVVLQALAQLVLVVKAALALPVVLAVKVAL